jgi:hypothetical protein
LAPATTVKTGEAKIGATTTAEESFWVQATGTEVATQAEAVITGGTIQVGKFREGVLHVSSGTFTGTPTIVVKVYRCMSDGTFTMGETGGQPPAPLASISIAASNTHVSQTLGVNTTGVATPLGQTIAITLTATGTVTSAPIVIELHLKT